GHFKLYLYFKNLCYYIFFYSSRRRHTRFSRDWSSDVCSSDLPGQLLVIEVLRGVGDEPIQRGLVFARQREELIDVLGMLVQDARSEERRVGKECTSLCSSHNE